jgi:hypothetical protein
MQISRFDAALYLGTAEPTSAATLALGNVLKLDKAQAGRMRVNFIVETALAGGTNCTFLVQGSNDNSNWATVESSPAVATASLVKDANFDVGVPQNFNYKYLRAAVTTTGTYTAGKISAALDVYQGA